MKITPLASEFFGILASAVKMSRGYMAYIGGCVSKSRIVKLTALTRLKMRSYFALYKVVVYCERCNVYGLGTTHNTCIRFCKLGTST